MQNFKHKSVSETVYPDLKFKSTGEWLKYIASQNSQVRNTKTK